MLGGRSTAASQGPTAVGGEWRGGPHRSVRNDERLADHAIAAAVARAPGETPASAARRETARPVRTRQQAPEPECGGADLCPPRPGGRAHPDPRARLPAPP